MDSITDMNFSIMEYNDIEIVRIMNNTAGIDIAKDFKNLLLEIIEQKKITNFLIDFTEVTFVDSAFLGAMVFAYKNAMQQQGKIKIFGLSNEIKMRFAITNLDTIIQIFESQEEGIISFS